MESVENVILKEMTLASDEVFFIFDIAKGAITYVNSALEKLTKIKVDDAINSPDLLFRIVHPDDQDYVKDNLKHFSKKKTGSLLDFRIIRADNVERWVRLKVYPILKGNRVEYLSGMVEDDSARKTGIFNMEKVSGWKNAALEIISHDLRGPIGVVRLLSNAIANKLSGSDNRQIQEWTQMIEDICKRNLQLIQSLISKEAIDTHAVALSRERLDLVNEVSEVMRIFKHSEYSINRNFEFTFSHDKIHAEADSMKFLQIMNNLISNAIKFTHENGHIRIHLERLEKTVLITVADDGVGIPLELYPVLFKKYTEAGRRGTDGEESIGLGMWIIKSFTEAHGGRVWFESQEGEGSKFYVELPLCTEV